MSGVQRILIVGPSWVGDMVMSHSLIQVLHERVVGASIDVLAPAWSLSLVTRMPGVNDAIAMPLGHGEFNWATRRHLGRSLRASNYDRAIVIPRSFKSALVPYHARIRRRTGFVGEVRFLVLNDRRTLDKQVLNTTQKRYVALGLERNEPFPSVLPAPTLSVDTANMQRLRERYLPAMTGQVVALMPGAEYGPAKQWPADYFQELTRMLTAKGVGVMVLGSAKEAELGATIVDGEEALAVNLCGTTSLTDAVDLLACADAAVTNDSGLMHVAAAVGTPLVAIYGSSSPAFTPPLSAKAHVMYKNLSCSPCFKRDCPLGHTRCLYDISPTSIANTLDAVFATAAS